MRTRRLLTEFSKRSDGLGILASRLEATFESLSTFLRIRGVGRIIKRNGRCGLPLSGARSHLVVHLSVVSVGWRERCRS